MFLPIPSQKKLPLTKQQMTWSSTQLNTFRYSWQGPSKDIEQLTYQWYWCNWQSGQSDHMQGTHMFPIKKWKLQNSNPGWFLINKFFFKQFLLQQGSWRSLISQDLFINQQKLVFHRVPHPHLCPATLSSCASPPKLHGSLSIKVDVNPYPF